MRRQITQLTGFHPFHGFHLTHEDPINSFFPDDQKSHVKQGQHFYYFFIAPLSTGAPVILCPPPKMLDVISL